MLWPEVARDGSLIFSFATTCLDGSDVPSLLANFVDNEFGAFRGLAVVSSLILDELISDLSALGFVV
jgi:hypothetical protein